MENTKLTNFRVLNSLGEKIKKAKIDFENYQESDAPNWNEGYNYFQGYIEGLEISFSIVNDILKESDNKENIILNDALCAIESLGK